MLRFPKALNLSRKIGFSLLILILAGGIASVQATPVCTTTMVLPTGNGTLLDSQLGAGVCVQSQDKLYGNFNFGNIPASGSVTFVFVSLPGGDQHSITFNASFTPGVAYNDSFEVEVLEGGMFQTNNFITQLRADIPQTVGGPSTLVQTTTPAPNSGSISFSKTNNVVTGNFVDNFTGNVADLVVNSTLTLGPASDASAELDTIVEAAATPEPISVETLLVALTGLAFGYLKLKPRRS